MIAWLRRRLQSWMRPRQPESLPVRLRRNRIYVLPTATGLFFALLLGTMGLGALNFNNNPGLLLALLLAGAAQASLIAAHMQLSGVVVDAVAATIAAPSLPSAVRGVAVTSNETSGPSPAVTVWAQDTWTVPGVPVVSTRSPDAAPSWASGVAVPTRRPPMVMV